MVREIELKTVPSSAAEVVIAEVPEPILRLVEVKETFDHNSFLNDFRSLSAITKVATLVVSGGADWPTTAGEM
jgi:hypothetical protein